MRNHCESVTQIWTSPCEEVEEIEEEEEEEVEEEEEEDEEGEEEEEEERKNILAVWWLSGSILLRCFLGPMGVLFIMKTLEDEW